MIRLLLLIFLILPLTCTVAQGIRFDRSSLTEVLEKARQSDKAVFLFAYSETCRLCRNMSLNVFTDKEVGILFNENFVNIRMPMSEARKVLALPELYMPRIHPTMLFLDSKGRMIHEAAGYANVENVLEIGKKATSDNEKLSYLIDRYDSGEREDAVLVLLADAYLSAGINKYEQIAREYLQRIENWDTPAIVRFLFKFGKATIDSDLFRYSLQKEKLFRKIIGDKVYEDKIDYAAFLDMSPELKRSKNVSELMVHYSKYYPKKIAILKAKRKYLVTLMNSNNPLDQKKFLNYLEDFLKDEPEYEWTFYNAVAWEAHLLTKDKSMLKKCNRWADLSLADDENFYNCDTKANISYYLGNKNVALKYAQKALEYGKKIGEDISLVKALLSKIKDLP